MKTEFLVIPCDQGKVRFIDRATSEPADPLDVLNLAASGACAVVRESEIGRLTTELKAFGAPDDGVLTTVGYIEHEVKFILVVE